MPKWGLTDRHINSKPWGLPKEALIPSKTITDPVHGDIYINEIERMIVDSAPIQRLRRVRQLGSTHLVYPGATHTRFSHTLGALRVAQDLLDAVLEQRYAPKPAQDLFKEWEEGLKEKERDKHIAEAIVLARLGALLHDMCHVPYGHSVEDDIGILDPHDSNVQRFETLWKQFDEIIRNLISDELKSALRPLILSKEESSATQGLEDGPYAFVQDIVGNTICADLLDYLPRDHLYTGLPAKLGHRFIDGFYVTNSEHPVHPRRMVMRICRDGRERADVVSELFKYLRYRYELSERALVHHAKLAADAMIGKLLVMWGDAIWIDFACEDDPTLAKVKGDVDKVKDKIIPNDPNKVKRFDKLVRDKLEEEFLRYGDDGLIEYILALVSSEKKEDSRLAAIESLATRIQTRNLYKLIAQCKSAKPQAKEIHKNFGKPEERRRLEEGAARYAGIKHRWHILLWIPSWKMRLKAAEVLVEDKDNQIVKLTTHDVRGEDISDNHMALWSISAFAPVEVKQDEMRMHAALAWIAKEISIKWDGTVPSLPILAARHIGSERALARTTEEELADALDKELSGSGRNAATLESFDELIVLGEEVYEKMSLPDTAEDLLSEDSVLKVLSGYLPKTLRKRDREKVDDYVPEFVAQVNGLTKKQRNFVKRKLSSMEPADGRQLQAASTRVDSIKSILEKLLNDAKNN